MGSLLLRDGVVVTMNPARAVLPRASVLVREGRIAGIGDAETLGPAGEVIDCRRKIILPGLVDLHGYLGGSILRSLAEDLSARERREVLERILSNCIDLDYWALDARLGAVEKLRFGTTCMFTMLGGNGTRTDDVRFAQYAARALTETGLRTRIGVGPARPPWPRRYTMWEDGHPVEHAIDFDTAIDNCDRILAEWRAGVPGLVDYCVALSRFGNRNPHDPVWSPEREKWVGRQAEAARYLMQKHNVGFWTHAYGNAVDYAHDERLGLLGPRSVMSHCTDIGERAIAIMAESGTHAAHHPRAARIYSTPGRCPLPEMLAAGVNVALGSDAPANHDCDLFKDMRAAVRAQRIYFKDTSLLPAGTTLEMATINGYRALGLDDVLGSVEVGKFADLITVGMDRPHLVPFDMPLHRLVNHVSGLDVSDVLVGGRLVLRGRHFTEVDVPALLAGAEEMYDRVLTRAGLRRELNG